MARYGQSYKDRVVAPALPPESSAVGVASREVGVRTATPIVGPRRRGWKP